MQPTLKKLPAPKRIMARPSSRRTSQSAFAEKGRALLLEIVPSREKQSHFPTHEIIHWHPCL
jgi:hypothetical protein